MTKPGIAMDGYGVKPTTPRPANGGLVNKGTVKVEPVQKPQQQQPSQTSRD